MEKSFFEYYCNVTENIVFAQLDAEIKEQKVITLKECAKTLRQQMLLLRKELKNEEEKNVLVKNQAVIFKRYKEHLIKKIIRNSIQKELKNRGKLKK